MIASFGALLEYRVAYTGLRATVTLVYGDSGDTVDPKTLRGGHLNADWRPVEDGSEYELHNKLFGNQHTVVTHKRQQTFRQAILYPKLDNRNLHRMIQVVCGPADGTVDVLSSIANIFCRTSGSLQARQHSQPYLGQMAEQMQHNHAAVPFIKQVDAFKATECAMKFDDILRHIGEFGPYQRRICLFVLIPLVTLGIDSMSVIFALATPEYRCSIPNLPNDTFRSQEQWHNNLVNMSMPIEDGKPSMCHKFTNDSGDESGRNRSISKCTSWVFDHSVYEVAGGEEFSLVCDRIYLRSLSNSISYSGTLMVFLFGVISDMIGRRRCFFIVVLLCACTGFGKAFCSFVECYTALRFVNSASRSGLYMTGFVICMELAGPSKRIIVGMAGYFAWAIGLLILGGLAYVLRNWHYIQLCPAIVNVLYLGMWCPGTLPFES
ncbi:organic cation transporter protein-like [Gigantopelta aegis]|uniref:organic cation transporter protein-like n=1 Tax=Gigantopelta aegis TaxID=1735272 RepID=UPI001B888A6A|nr:organic cation transporter protein-like [Gigantopelta aegis]